MNWILNQKETKTWRITMLILVTILIPSSVLPQLYINEILASNVNTGYDTLSNNFNDWIEIYNDSDQSVDVGGFYLTDDMSKPTQWQFPSDRPDETTIDPINLHTFIGGVEHNRSVGGIRIQATITE